MKGTLQAWPGLSHKLDHKGTLSHPFIPKGSLTKPDNSQGTWPGLGGETLQAQETATPKADWGLFRSLDQTTDCWRRPSPTGSGYIGRHGFSLSRSYQQEYSTAYNTQSHIKVVYNGYILTHISN